MISCNDEDAGGIDAGDVVKLKDQKAWKVMKHNRIGGVSESDARFTNSRLELAAITQSDYRDGIDCQGGQTGQYYLHSLPCQSRAPQSQGDETPHNFNNFTSLKRVEHAFQNSPSGRCDSLIMTTKPLPSDRPFQTMIAVSFAVALHL